MEVWDDTPPAPPLARVKDHRIALVASGVVRWDNPDRFKTYRNTHWQKYNIAELKELEPGKWETVHGGYNVVYRMRTRTMEFLWTRCERWKQRERSVQASYTRPIMLFLAIRVRRR
jgi:Glycine/sarcosine/betaine reductase selenoprotein B (GRDB)